jgi:tetratricopeptide (TPR) repeat protein
MYHPKQSEEKLNDLFNYLQETKDEYEIGKIETQIWEIWLDSGSPQLNVLMEKGAESVQKKEHTQAIEYFSQIITLNPDFAEGWNKRATAYFLRGDYKASLLDIEETLRLEPRHFGAISGMISIYMVIHDLKGALKSYRLLQRIYPQKIDLAQQIKNLQERIS